MPEKFKYPFNVVAKDTVSGFTGKIIVRTAHLFGCSQYGLAPQELSSNGSPRDTEFFDEARIEILDDKDAIDTIDHFNNIYSIPLGSEVKDKVTGFKGKVLVGVEYLHNCNRYYVQQDVNKEGKIGENEWFDEGSLEIIGEGISPKEVEAPKRGSVFSRDLPRI